MIDGQKRSFLKFQDVRAFLDSVLDEDIHTKRVDSLANATLGVMTGASRNRSPPSHSNCDRNREVMQVCSGAGESVGDV